MKNQLDASNLNMITTESHRYTRDELSRNTKSANATADVIEGDDVEHAADPNGCEYPFPYNDLL